MTSDASHRTTAVSSCASRHRRPPLPRPPAISPPRRRIPPSRRPGRRRRAPREPHLSIPLAPSRARALRRRRDRRSGWPRRRRSRRRRREPAAPSPRASRRRQSLPARHAHARAARASADARREPAGKRPRRLRRQPRRRAARQRARTSIVDREPGVLRDAGVRGRVRAEQPARGGLVAEIPPPDGKGPPLRLNGRIDRLAVTDHEVLIIDYKTNRPPPSEAAGVAPAYLFQLAAYRLALGRIYPGRPVRAAILWTDGAAPDGDPGRPARRPPAKAVATGLRAP